MVKLRLKRLGKKHQPSYRIIAIQARTKRQGRSLEELGHYSPMNKTLKIDKERVEYWLSVGAQPTQTVENLLIKEKILPERKHKKVFKNSPKNKAKERAKKKIEKQAKKEEKKEKKEEK